MATEKLTTKAASNQAATPNYQERATGDSQNIARVPKQFMDLFEHDPSEVILKQATKHPVGIVFIYLVAVFSVGLVVGGLGLLLNDSEMLGLADASGGTRALVAFLALIVCAVVGLVAVAAVSVYTKSRMILTNQKIVFIRYHSLFSREISQLNIGEVEDVNVSQRTVFDRIFKMGTMTIETAGEQNNYVFHSVATPHEFAKLTIQSHEGSIAEYGN